MARGHKCTTTASPVGRASRLQRAVTSTSGPAIGASAKVPPGAAPNVIEPACPSIMEASPPAAVRTPAGPTSGWPQPESLERLNVSLTITPDPAGEGEAGALDAAADGVGLAPCVAAQPASAAKDSASSM